MANTKEYKVNSIGTPASGSNVHYIGAAPDGGMSHCKLHKFMAFKECLTEKQLMKVLQKYGFYLGEQ